MSLSASTSECKLKLRSFESEIHSTSCEVNSGPNCWKGVKESMLIGGARFWLIDEGLAPTLEERFWKPPFDQSQKQEWKLSCRQPSTKIFCKITTWDKLFLKSYYGRHVKLPNAPGLWKDILYSALQPPLWHLAAWREACPFKKSMQKQQLSQPDPNHTGDVWPGTFLHGKAAKC